MTLQNTMEMVLVIMEIEMEKCGGFIPLSFVLGILVAFIFVANMMPNLMPTFQLAVDETIEESVSVHSNNGVLPYYGDSAWDDVSRLRIHIAKEFAGILETLEELAEMIGATTTQNMFLFKEMCAVGGEEKQAFFDELCMGEERLNQLRESYFDTIWFESISG